MNVVYGRSREANRSLASLSKTNNIGKKRGVWESWTELEGVGQQAAGRSEAQRSGEWGSLLLVRKIGSYPETACVADHRNQI